MTIEAATYVSQLDAAHPTGTEVKSEGDDHLRLIKSTLVTTFPSITGAVTVTHTDLNGVTGKAAKAGDTYTGTHDFSGGSLVVPSTARGDNSTAAASTAFVQTLLADYAGSALGLVLSIATGSAVSISAGQMVAITNASAVTVTLPAAPTVGQLVAVIVCNSRADNVIARNGNPIMGIAEDMTINAPYASVTLAYTNSAKGWRIV